MSEAKRMEAARWIERVLRGHGIRLVRFGPRRVSMLNVPAKWSGIVDDLANGIQSLAAGEGLPGLVDDAPEDAGDWEGHGPDGGGLPRDLDEGDR